MANITNFADVEGVLAKHVPNARQFREAYTLDNMRKLMDFLGNPQDTYKVIHVAGTSGKTSTAYYVASLLMQSKAKVGLTVSPHVDKVNERVQIDLQPVPEDEYCTLFGRFIDLVKESGVYPTYFEMLVAFAYWVFAQKNVDYAVVEVGLGGLLDGTNVITRSDKLSILTDIGLDHVDILGNDISEIAQQKAGIIVPNSTVFCLRQSKVVDEVFQAEAEKQNAQLHQLTYQTPAVASNLPMFQQRNWFLAHGAVAFVLNRDGALTLTNDQKTESTKVHIPARMEILKRGSHTVILDTAHNPQKMQALVTSLKAKYPEQKFAVLMALLRSKDQRLSGVLKELLPITNHLIVTDFVAGQDLRKNSTTPEDIVVACRAMGFDSVEIIQDTVQAYETLKQRPESHQLVTGSFYLLHDMHKMLGTL